MLARLPWSLPVKATTKARPKQLNKDRRRHLVETVAAILKAGEPTYFSFEATCRCSLRSRFCLEGWGWQDADAAAADVVAASLKQIGAQRPTWQQGQPEFNEVGVLAVESVVCVRCKGPLDETLGYSGRKIRFCSKLCRVAHSTAQWKKRQGEELAAKEAVWKRKALERHRANTPEQPCDRCGTMFIPGRHYGNRPPQRFCSKRCVAHHASDVEREMRRKGQF